ncbi:hypothetical protein MVI27_07670 [Chryseobacterium salipaludis]|uniref:hypothetical protein n=1 Tax=Chryseobacterium TaxID=59732 RepID=UPI001FF28B75|nr:MULTISPECIES: hypothetical protein [Chryseobacterium]MCJ8498135.1 hypothetical protein [Chryseobacterium salipaludis]MCX3296667.1 hypothetical protein [Planobacterium sp. JC490]
MSLNILIKKNSTCGKYNFSIYSHKLSMSDLDAYILQLLYEENKLNYLFQKNIPISKKQRKIQLQKFLEDSFINREAAVIDTDIMDAILSKNNETYYSFFAEALLARLNIDYIDQDLITGVINVNENLTKVSTGADVCMFSETNLVLGEAKFYSYLNQGIHSIIKDASFKSKLSDYIKNITSSETEIVLKGITGDICEKTVDEIKALPLTLSGFVLHTKNKTNMYDKTYDLIDKIEIDNFPPHYKVHLYHLPIESKNELIFKAQRMALDLIIAL